MPRTRRTTVKRQTISRATIRRRGRQAEAAAQERAAKLAESKARREAPETLGQARVWTRKALRYELAGLCTKCAAQAAWGHAQGFGEIKDPCAACQPIVNAFPGDGPRGSKWRKILDKLEYMSETELGEWLDAHNLS
jgi:hypothetical protein